MRHILFSMRQNNFLILESVEEILDFKLTFLLVNNYPQFVRQVSRFEMPLNETKIINKIVGQLNVRYDFKIDLAFTLKNVSNELVNDFSITSNGTIIFYNRSNFAYSVNKKTTLIACVQGNIIPIYESCTKVTIKIIKK
jgi:hypothetical protein